ncbi:MAG: hypothetical protein D6714_08115 [Bacteroidetes bacterium]|nr:MAG: hypothetical protein D6714_08115 [Bacteroidota bacterium]
MGCKCIKFVWWAVFSIQWAVFSWQYSVGRVFHSNETRAGKGRKPEACASRPKQMESFIFTLNKTI